MSEGKLGAGSKRRARNRPIVQGRWVRGADSTALDLVSPATPATRWRRPVHPRLRIAVGGPLGRIVYLPPDDIRHGHQPDHGGCNRERDDGRQAFSPSIVRRKRVARHELAELSARDSIEISTTRAPAIVTKPQ